MIIDEDVYLEHVGVKGMRWGVRRRGRIERTAAVGAGKKGALDKARVHVMANPVDLAKTRSFRKAAERKALRMDARNTRLATKGQAKVRDYLVEMATQRPTDIFPSARSKKLNADQRSNLAKMNSGKAFIISVPLMALAGARIAQNLRRV